MKRSEAGSDQRGTRPHHQLYVGSRTTPELAWWQMTPPSSTIQLQMRNMSSPESWPMMARAAPSAASRTACAGSSHGWDARLQMKVAAGRRPATGEGRSGTPPLSAAHCPCFASTAALQHCNCTPTHPPGCRSQSAPGKRAAPDGKRLNLKHDGNPTTLHHPPGCRRRSTRAAWAGFG